MTMPPAMACGQRQLGGRTKSVLPCAALLPPVSSFAKGTSRCMDACAVPMAALNPILYTNVGRRKQWGSEPAGLVSTQPSAS